MSNRDVVNGTQLIRAFHLKGVRARPLKVAAATVPEPQLSATCVTIFTVQDDVHFSTGARPPHVSSRDGEVVE